MMMVINCHVLRFEGGAAYARESIHLKLGARARSRVHRDRARGVVRLVIAVEGGRPPDRWLSARECENRWPCLSVLGHRRSLVELIGLRVCEGEDRGAGRLLAAAAGPTAGPGVLTFGGE